MKTLRIWVLLIIAWCVPTPARAQSNPPFQNPALDSNCYFPQIGDPTEMDTILGSDTNQYLGSLVKNMGTKPNGGYGNMLIENLIPPPVSHTYYSTYTITQVATGPRFSLHQMKEYVQNLAANGPDEIGNGFHMGHYRDQAHLDMFVNYNWRIYWADDAGNYDSTRFTDLRANIRPGDFTNNNGIGRNLIEPYIAHLTSDTVDDIVTTAFSDYNDFNNPNAIDTAYVLLFRGGEQLHVKDTVFEDTSDMLQISKPKDQENRSCTQADFRGMGRDDLIVSNYVWSNGPQGLILCYYKNDPPFSLEKFVQAVNKDTVFEDSSLIEFGYFTMPAIPKQAGDRSVDFLLTTKSDTVGILSIYIFRGAPDFGSHRFTLDSAAFVIPHPRLEFGTDPSNWPQALADAGDMTGTGNHVLNTSARNDYGDYWWDLFFVMGKALDNKVDIYNSHPYSEWPGDTLTANSDSLEDYLFGLSWPNGPNGPTGAGALWLYYGSKEIPVHLNPQWADVKTEIEKIPQQNGAGIILSPNPANGWSVATIIWPEAEEGEYIITDMLGREVQRDQIQFLGGGQENRISFPELPQGAYAVTLVGQHGTATARLIKLASANAPQSGTSRSFMQNLRDAAHGATPVFSKSATSPPLFR